MNSFSSWKHLLGDQSLERLGISDLPNEAERLDEQLEIDLLFEVSRVDDCRCLGICAVYVL